MLNRNYQFFTLSLVKKLFRYCVYILTLVIFSKFSPSTVASHFQRTSGEKLKLLHFSKNWPLSVRCPLTIRARTSGRNFAKFDQRV